MGLMLKSKLGSRVSHNGTRRYPTVSSPTSELLVSGFASCVVVSF